MTIYYSESSPIKLFGDNEPKYIIHIFKAGTHKDNAGKEHTFTANDLRKIASFSNETQGITPVVIGHPKDDNPRHGKVVELFVEGDDLYAKATLSNQLKSKIEAGEYPHVSAAFWDIEAEQNNAKGQSSTLRHVGFLDKSTPPAVKGLKPVKLNEIADDFTFIEHNDGANTYSEQLHEQILYFQESTDCSYQNAFQHVISVIKAHKEKQASNNSFVDPTSSEELHHKILAYQKQAGGSYTDAFHHVTKGA